MSVSLWRSRPCRNGVYCSTAKPCRQGPPHFRRQSQVWQAKPLAVAANGRVQELEASRVVDRVVAQVQIRKLNTGTATGPAPGPRRRRCGCSASRSIRSAAAAGQYARIAAPAFPISLCPRSSRASCPRPGQGRHHRRSRRASTRSHSGPAIRARPTPAGGGVHSCGVRTWFSAIPRCRNPARVGDAHRYAETGPSHLVAT